MSAYAVAAQDTAGPLALAPKRHGRDSLAGNDADAGFDAALTETANVSSPASGPASIVAAGSPRLRHPRLTAMGRALQLPPTPRWLRPAARQMKRRRGPNRNRP